MIKKRLLIAEDDELSRSLLQEMLTGLGYDTVAAENGKAALDLYNENPFSVVITDIDMPFMDGNELISILNEKKPAPVIIVQTIHSDIPNVIDTMKRGVYDYIVKPLRADDIRVKLDHAFENAELKKTNEILRNERINKLEDRLEWVKWNESFIKRDYDRIDSALFKSLHTSFNQGAGFGALLTLIQLFISSGEKQGDKYLVNGQLYEMVKDSSILAQNTIDIFSELHTIFNSSFNLKRISLEELHIMIKKFMQETEHYAPVNNNSLLLSDSKYDFSSTYTAIDSHYLGKAVKELIINAMKFSRPHTSILIIMETQKDTAKISVISSPEKDDHAHIGIPPEYETIIFEPFFRMQNNVYEKFDTIDYGLGLTMVSKIATKHNGSAAVETIKDSTNIRQEPEIRVSFTITLPLVK